jgi:hypothetical protein
MHTCQLGNSNHHLIAVAGTIGKEEIGIPPVQQRRVQERSSEELDVSSMAVRDTSSPLQLAFLRKRIKRKQYFHPDTSMEVVQQGRSEYGLA